MVDHNFGLLKVSDPFRGSSSAVSLPIFATKASLFSVFRAQLHICSSFSPFQISVIFQKLVFMEPFVLINTFTTFAPMFARSKFIKIQFVFFSWLDCYSAGMKYNLIEFHSLLSLSLSLFPYKTLDLQKLERRSNSRLKNWNFVKKRLPCLPKFRHHLLSWISWQI